MSDKQYDESELAVLRWLCIAVIVGILVLLARDAIDAYVKVHAPAAIVEEKQ